MRFRTFCSSLLALSALTTRAVTIPDPAFAAVLELHVPDAIDGDQLDGLHADVLALTNLSFPGAGVTNITGIGYFANLQILDISNNPISTLPALPAFLTTLDITGTLLTELPVLPSGISSLTMNDVPIAVVENLPSSLTWLDISYCDAPQLGLLPTGLTHLLMYGCGYTTFPAFQGPAGLLLLYFSYNPVQSVPDLPTSLVAFECDECGLSALPPLPPGLQNLWVPNNDLDELPALPGTLVELNCSNTSVAILPPLPQGMTHLYIENTPLAMTGPLPPGLLVMYASGTPLYCLPNVPATLVQLQLPITVECLPEPLPPTAEEYVVIEGYPYPPPCTDFNAACELKPYIAGLTFHDSNGNGVNDDGGAGMPWSNLIVQPGGAMMGSNGSGHFSKHMLPGSYTVEVQPGPYQVVTTGPRSAELPDYASTATGNDHGVMLQPDITDMRVHYTSFSVIRPGFAFSGRIFYQNVGSEDADGTITFTHDPGLSLVSAFPTPSQVDGNVLSWDFTSAVLQAPGAIDLTFGPVALPLGTLVSNTVGITPSTTDANPVDNQFTERQTVIGSYDPNDKRVVPATLTPEEVAAGMPVRYTIRFQNTGTAEAFMVRIKDQLDPRLDVSGFRFLASSHACDWFIETGELIVVYPDINLPDSASDEAGSHGFFTFEIPPLPSILSGESIDNIAGIHFDFNEPVLTGPATFTVESSTGIPAQEGEELRLSPNPAQDRLFLRTAIGSGTWTLSDATGRILMNGVLRGELTAIGIEALPGGAYVIRSRSRNGMSTARFIKQ